MTKEEQHNKYAPYWAIAMIIFGLTGISATWIESSDFLKGYVLDICVPAWNYILFRGLFTTYRENTWFRFFTPIRTFFIFVIVTFGIELLQYLEVYGSTFDPWDLLAYISLLLPIFIIDLSQRKHY